MPVMNPAKPFVVAVLLMLAACMAQPPTPAPEASDALALPLTVPDAGAVVARVGGVGIRQAWLDAMARGRGLDLADPQQRARALDELIEYAVLVAAAREHADLAAVDVRAEIELNALAGRANAVLGRLGAASEPDEASMRREYDQQSAINGNLEYKVAHLLFLDQALAAEAGAKLSADKDFSAVQNQYRERAQQAIELGWIKLGQVPEPFAAALRELEPGLATPQPVQTQYGWHVIHLYQTRPFQPPGFEQVREGIRRMLVARSTRAVVEGLKAQADIEILPEPN